MTASSATSGTARFFFSCLYYVMLQMKAIPRTIGARKVLQERAKEFTSRVTYRNELVNTGSSYTYWHEDGLSFLGRNVQSISVRAIQQTKDKLPVHSEGKEDTVRTSNGLDKLTVVQLSTWWITTTTERSHKSADLIKLMYKIFCHYSVPISLPSC